MPTAHRQSPIDSCRAERKHIGENSKVFMIATSTKYTERFMRGIKHFIQLPVISMGRSFAQMLASSNSQMLTHANSLQTREGATQKATKSSGR